MPSAVKLAQHSTRVFSKGCIMTIPTATLSGLYAYLARNRAQFPETPHPKQHQKGSFCRADWQDYMLQPLSRLRRCPIARGCRILSFVQPSRRLRKCPVARGCKILGFLLPLSRLRKCPIAPGCKFLGFSHHPRRLRMGLIARGCKILGFFHY